MNGSRFFNLTIDLNIEGTHYAALFLIINKVSLKNIKTIGVEKLKLFVCDETDKGLVKYHNDVFHQYMLVVLNGVNNEPVLHARIVLQRP